MGQINGFRYHHFQRRLCFVLKGHKQDRQCAGIMARRVVVTSLSCGGRLSAWIGSSNTARGKFVMVSFVQVYDGNFMLPRVMQSKGSAYFWNV